jgi:hypothetical protein
MAELTYEKVLSLFQETDRKFQDTDRKFQETDRKFQETAQRFQELDKYLKDLSEKADKRNHELGKRLGDLGNSLGGLVETLIAARLWEKFVDYPYNLQRSYRGVPVFNEKNIMLTEIDILLSDTEWVMAVEVKQKLKTTDVDHHIKRLELIQNYPPAEAKGKKLLGAIAGGEGAADVKTYAHNAGFFVLELRGESVDLITPPQGFTPKTW